MEQLIIWIVIVAFGLGIDAFRKAKKSREEAPPRPDPPRMPGFEAWTPQMPEAPLAELAAKRAETETRKEARKELRKAGIQPPSREGERVTASEPRPAHDPNTTPMAADADSESRSELADHYERWRRAIIDTEILRRPLQ